MAQVPLQIPPGLVRGATPYDTPGRWYDMNLVRWRGGHAMPVGGWNRVTSTPLDSAVRRINVWRNNANTRMVLVGTDAKLYVDQGSYVDITPSGFSPLSGMGTSGGYGTFNYGQSTFGTARALPSPIYSPYPYWTFGMWGEDVILTANSDGHLFHYAQSTPTTAPTVISGAPTGNNAVIVTPERHAMVFGTGGDGRKVAWCSREDYTDWNYASTTNTAGFLNLTSRTPLLKGVIVQEGILAFSYTDIFLLQYVGQPYIYGGTAPISSTSMFNPNCIATFNGKAVWPSRMGFQLYAGGFVQPLDCPILGDLFEDMDPLWGPFRIHGSHNGVFPEIWWFYPSNGSQECDRYVIWNYAENWWGWGALPRSAMSEADAYKLPYMGSPTGIMYQHEDGWLDAGNSRVGSVWLESSALNLDMGTTLDVSQMRIATGHGAGDLTVTAYGQYAPEGAEYTFGPFIPRSDGYTDARFSAASARLRFTGATDDNWSLGKIFLDVMPGSGR